VIGAGRPLTGGDGVAEDCGPLTWLGAGVRETWPFTGALGEL
jgi:hypothetical protein